MDYNLNGPLKLCVLVLTILDFQRRLVFSAPAHTSCIDIERAQSQSKLLGEEVNELLDEYRRIHGFRPDYDADQILDPRIVGVKVSDKLQDVYKNNQVLNLHVAKVKEYHKEISGNSEDLSRILVIVKERLSLHLVRIKTILDKLFPQIHLPPAPATLNVHHEHSYDKKDYGLSVIVTLKDWHGQVLQVLNQTKDSCEQQV